MTHTRSGLDEGVGAPPSVSALSSYRRPTDYHLK